MNERINKKKTILTASEQSMKYRFLIIIIFHLQIRSVAIQCFKFVVVLGIFKAVNQFKWAEFPQHVRVL